MSALSQCYHLCTLKHIRVIIKSTDAVHLSLLRIKCKSEVLSRNAQRGKILDCSISMDLETLIRRRIRHRVVPSYQQEAIIPYIHTLKVFW